MDDATLVAAAVGGDRDAWGAIYDRYADRLHDHCWSILRDEHEAADALHDAFVNAARALPQLRDPSRLRPWLYAIARNEAYRRHRARARAVPTEQLGEDDIGELGTVTVDLEEGSGSPVDDLRRLVWDAAGGLSADDQALLDLHLRQGLEGQDLAEAMGISANNAYVKLSRLRDTMERSLGALLVARTGRAECQQLAEILAGWDGELTPLLRKRVARHVDECATCGERKRSMVSPLALFAGMPMVPAPPGSREAILADTVAASAAAKPPDALFPTPPFPTASSPTASSPTGPPGPPGGAVLARAADDGAPWRWIAVGAGAVVLLVAGLLFVLRDDDGGALASGDTTTSTTFSSTSSTSSTSTSTSSTSTSSTTSTTAPGRVALSTTDLDLGASATSGEFELRNPGGAPVSYSLTTSTPRLAVSRRAGTLQPGVSHTVVVALDRDGAREGAFAGTVRLDAGSAGTGAVGVTATIAARPPEISDLSTSEPFVYTALQPACPNTEVIVTFTDENTVSGVLRFQSISFPDDAVDLTVTGDQARGALGRPNTAEEIIYTVTLTDVLGASVTTEPQTIQTEPTC